MDIHNVWTQLTASTTPLTHLPLSFSSCCSLSSPSMSVSPAPSPISLCLLLFTPSYTLPPHTHIYSLMPSTSPISACLSLLFTRSFAIVNSHKTFPGLVPPPPLSSHFLICAPSPLSLYASFHSFIYPHWHIDTLVQLQGLTHHLFTSHWRGWLLWSLSFVFFFPHSLSTI